MSGLMAKIGMFGLGWQVYWTNLAAHAVVAFVGLLSCSADCVCLRFEPGPESEADLAVSDLDPLESKTGSLSP